MADARALLQQQRASRRITHTYARYTDSGKLLCSLCDLLIKSDAVWNSHLKTPEHAKRALRAAEASQKKPTGKKRKAGSGSEDGDDGRKRVRGTDELDEEAEEPERGRAKVVRFAEPELEPEPDEREADVEVETLDETVIHTTPPDTGAAENLEEDPEWLELQQMLTDTKQQSEQEAMYANATISAPAMSAEEIAAKAREEQSSQRGRREAELEEEKEDAAAQLEAEFDEMDELEERVRKLREKREALRASRGEVDRPGGTEVLTGMTQGEIEAGAENVVMEEDGDEDDEADMDDWNFGGD